MSYILDALRKADAERERGAVPGLHTQPLQAAAAAGASRTGAPATRWLVAGGLALAALVLAWWTLQRPDAEAPTAAAAPPRVVAAPPAGSLGPTPTPSPAPTLAPPPARPPATAAAPLAARPARPAVFATTPALAASAVDRIFAVKELPDAIRRDLPPLAIGGAMYSTHAASRMLIINGQVFHEREQIAPDHVLEEIRLKSAVLRYKGVRYGIDY